MPWAAHLLKEDGPEIKMFPGCILRFLRYPAKCRRTPAGNDNLTPFRFLQYSTNNLPCHQWDGLKNSRRFTRRKTAGIYNPKIPPFNLRACHLWQVRILSPFDAYHDDIFGSDHCPIELNIDL